LVSIEFRQGDFKIRRNKAMDLKISGKDETVPEGISISDLLKEKGIERPETVSVELNGEILNRTEFDQTKLNNDDEVEFLFFMGGGKESLKGGNEPDGI
jgi:sulfur carrier protein